MLLLLFSKTVRRIIAAIVLTVIGIVLWTAGQVWWIARQDNHPRSDAIVVLGAAQFDGRPSEVFKARLDHAKKLYDDGVAPRIVTVGGGAPGDRTTEADAGADYLEHQGVENTVAIAVGRDTLQSLRALRVEFVKRGWKSAVLVTDPWHSLRARKMARDMDITASTSPTRTGPVNSTRSTQIRYVARETAAYLHYRVFGRSSSERGPNAV